MVNYYNADANNTPLHFTKNCNFSNFIRHSKMATSPITVKGLSALQKEIQIALCVKAYDMLPKKGQNKVMMGKLMYDYVVGKNAHASLIEMFLKADGVWEHVFDKSIDESLRSDASPDDSGMRLTMKDIIVNEKTRKWVLGEHVTDRLLRSSTCTMNVEFSEKSVFGRFEEGRTNVLKFQSKMSTILNGASAFSTSLLPSGTHYNEIFQKGVDEMIEDIGKGRGVEFFPGQLSAYLFSTMNAFPSERLSVFATGDKDTDGGEKRGRSSEKEEERKEKKKKSDDEDKRGLSHNDQMKRAQLSLESRSMDLQETETYLAMKSDLHKTLIEKTSKQAFAITSILILLINSIALWPLYIITEELNIKMLHKFRTKIFIREPMYNSNTIFCNNNIINFIC